MKQVKLIGGVLALAAIGWVMVTSSNEAIARDALQEVRDSLAEQSVLVADLAAGDRKVLEAKGVGTEAARSAALQDQASADSAEVFNGMVASQNSTSVPEALHDRLLYLVLLEGVDIPLRVGYSDDGDDVPMTVSVRFVVFVDALSGQVLMGTSL